MSTQLGWSKLVGGGLVIATLFLAAPAGAAMTAGSLIKTKAFADVYYLGADGKRYVFPNPRVFGSWYKKTSKVTMITVSAMSALQVGGNVTFKPGAKLVRIAPDTKVYVVSKGGTLRWVANEDVAATLYGNNWKQLVDDVDPANYVNYKVGASITTASQFDKASEVTVVTSIDSNLK